MKIIMMRVGELPEDRAVASLPVNRLSLNPLLRCRISSHNQKAMPSLEADRSVKFTVSGSNPEVGAAEKLAVGTPATDTVM